MDALASFERSWEGYASGFGDVDGNFWLGLEAMHDLTTAQPMKVQIDVVPINMPAVSLPHLQFHVGDAASDYVLTITSDTPGDGTQYTSMNYDTGRKLLTYDNDNDNNNYDERLREGWWLRAYCLVSLSGIYDDATGYQ